MKTKYHNKITTVDGIRFHSKREACYYQQLKMRVLAHDLKYFLRQVPIHLAGGTKYIVDFILFENDGSVRYIDVKGAATPMFNLKKKQVEATYPIIIEVVKWACPKMNFIKVILFLFEQL